MLLKSQITINTKQVISILEFQLSQAKNKLSELTEADAKIETVVAELESLLSQHPDYQSVVSARLSRFQPTPKPTPVRIEIESVENEDENEQLETIPEYAPVYLPFNIDSVPPRTEEDKILNPTDIGVEEQQQTPETEDEDIENWPIPEPTSLKYKMLECKCKQELESFKSEIGEDKTSELWNELSILQKNYIKTIETLLKPAKRTYIGVGTKLKYTAPDGKKHNARGIGHYLYGEPLKDSERAILVDGDSKPIIVKRSQLQPFAAKDQGYLDESELEKLQNFLTQPQQQPQQEEEEQLDAATIAALNFTGLSAPPKLQTGSQTGKQQDSEPSKANVEQPALPLKTEHPDPKKLPATPTPALQKIVQELYTYNPQAVSVLLFKYEQIEDSIFLTILHGDSEVACFEENDYDVYAVGDNKKLTFHGFTETQIDAAFQAGETVYEQLKKA